MPKIIELTSGEQVIVDNEDYVYLSKNEWNYTQGKITGYAKRSIRTATGVQTTIRMHREILKPKDNEIVDHINGNGLDNRRCNLRLVSAAQNAMNRFKLKRKCYYKGVAMVAEGRYRARIKANGKSAHLGYFSTAEDAAEAYDKAALKYFGSCASLNFKTEKIV